MSRGEGSRKLLDDRKSALWRPGGDEDNNDNDELKGFERDHCCRIPLLCCSCQHSK